MLHLAHSYSIHNIIYALQILMTRLYSIHITVYRFHAHFSVVFVLILYIERDFDCLAYIYSNKRSEDPTPCAYV